MKPELLFQVCNTLKKPICTEVSGIASDFEKSFRAGTKQEIVDHLLFCSTTGPVAGSVKTTCR